MTILAMDTSTETLTIALGDDTGQLIADFSLVMGKKHATLLHPLIDDMLSKLSMTPKDLTAVAVGLGPGSYTGVRIAVTAAKTLAFALHIPVLGVSSLLATAYAQRSQRGIVLVVFDARRNQAYTGLYLADDGRMVSLMEETKLSYEEAILRAGEFAKSHHQNRVIVVGDGIQHAMNYAESISPKVIPSYQQMMIGAKEVYQVALPEVIQRLTRAQGELTQDAQTLVPTYLQLAEAEAHWRTLQQERLTHDK